METEGLERPVEAFEVAVEAREVEEARARKELKVREGLLVSRVLETRSRRLLWRRLGLRRTPYGLWKEVERSRTLREVQSYLEWKCHKGGFRAKYPLELEWE